MAAVVGALLLVITTQAVSTASPTPPSAVAPMAIGDPPPDDYVPTEGLLFNHPFRKDRGQILSHVLRMIRSTPGGSSIKIATFGIAHRGVVDALIGARNRGVSVQVIGDSHLVKRRDPLYSRSFVRLRKTLGQNKAAPSWVIVCDKSCRGFGGNMHAKYYLFDNVSGVRHVVTTSSGNLTSMAVKGQWNHAKTVIDEATYNQFVGIFNEMALDVPAPQLPLEFPMTAPVGTGWLYPFPTMVQASDEMAAALSKVQCTITNPDGTLTRTKIRIGMFAWFEPRGIWLAQQVRQLWESGCDIAIETAVSSLQVKAILRARGGRGPIPAKRVVVLNANKEVVNYLHSKWLTIKGMYDGDPNAAIVVSGTCNFTSLGNYSDEFTAIYPSLSDLQAYNADFDAIWRERQAKPWRATYAPGYASRIAEVVPQFGVGRLRLAEPD